VSLLLNFSPVEFADAEIEVGVFPYDADGEEVLKKLREENLATHVFRRDGPDEIVAVPVAADAPKLGQGARKIRLKENPGLSAFLIRNSLINYLPTLENATRPIYIFDQTGSKSDTWNDCGLNQYGPYM